MGIFNKIKKWLTKKPKNEKVKEANRVTNYGGGVSSKSVQKEVKRSIVKAEAKKRGEKQTTYQQSAVSKSSNTAFKATPPSVRKAEAKDRQTSKKSDPFNAKNAFKASAQPKFSHQSTALGTMSTRDINSRIAKRNAADINQKYRSRAADSLKPLIDEKYSGDTIESKRRIKSGEYQSDPNVMKYETLKHPLAMSAARGQLNAWTLGAADALAKYGTKGELKEAEDLYQANKNKFVEGASEMAGTLASFALTGGASKALFGKVAPNKVARLGEGATELLAKNGIVRRAAEKEALRKLGTTATKAEIEHFARSKAAKIVEAIGGDMAVNLTTGGAYDILTSAAESDNPAEFFKNLGLNAATNVVLGGITSSVPVLRGSNVDDAFVRNRLAAREGLDDLAKRNRIGMGRPSELTLPKLNAVPDASDAVARYPAIEDAYLDYDGTIEAVNRYYNPDDTAEAAVDRYHDLDIQRAKPKAETKAEPPKAKTLAEPKVAESLAKNSDTVLGKSVEVPSEDIIKSGEGNYGGIPIKYAPKEHSEASSWGSEIHVSDKFFQQDAATQKHILNHEIAHNWSDDFMSEHTGDWQDFTAKFVKEKEVPPSSTAYANGQRTYYEGLYGDIGATSLSETTTRAITEYLDDPDALLKRSPEAYEAVEEFVERRIGARPSAQNIDAQVDDALNEVAEATAKAETPKVEVKAEAPKVEAEELPKPEAESLKETAQKRADEVMGAEYKEQKPKTKEIPEKTKKAADKKADNIRAELAKEDIDPNLKAENPEDNIRAALAEDKTKARAKEEKISKGQAAVREAYEEQTGESWKVGKNGFESDADKRATFDQLWDARKEYHQSQGRETERKLSKYASTQVRVASKERADYIIDNIIKHSQDAEYDVLHHEEVYREVAENLEKDWDTWVNKLSDVADGGDWGGKDTPKLLATAQFLGELIDDVPRTPETDALAKIAYLAGQKLTTSSAQTMNFRRHFAHLSPASKLDVIMDDLAKTLDNAQGFNKKHAKGLKGLNHWERLDYIKGQLMDDPKLKDAVEKMVYAKTPEELDVMKRRNEGLISQIEGLEKQKAELEKKLKAAEAKAKASGKATLPQDVDEMAQIKDLDVEIEGLNAQKQILDSQIEKAEKANVDPDELTKAQAKVIRAFNKHNAKTGYDVVQELRYIAMLLNPKTHIRNVGGSGFFSPVRDLSNTIRASMEEGVFKHYGMEVDVKHGGLTSLIGNTEAGKKATEAINKSEIRNALYGNSKLTELPTQRGRSKTLAGKALDAVSDFSSWTLKKEDDAFKTLAFKKNYIMSYNKYLKDGVPITPKIEAAIEAEAMQEAKIATFNEYNAVANALNKFYKNSTNANASGAMRWAARGTNALMPFTKAPANLMKQSINYSPLGLAKGMYAIKQAGKKGDAQALNRAIDELSSGVTGTGIYVLGALLGGTTDMFTTNVGKDDLGAKFKKDRGYQNYSVNFVDPETGKGHSFTLDWLVPNSAAFFMGVETANQIKKNGFSIFDVVHAAGDWAQVTSRLAEPVMDTSMLSGLNSMIEGVRGNYNGDDQLGVPHILLRETVQSYLNSLVPSVLGQTTRTLYKTDKQILGDSDWKYWANSTRSKAGLANLDIETLGGALGADTDVYGNVRNDKGKRFTEAVKDKDKAALTEYGKSALKNFFSPANIQKIDMSEVDKEKLAEYEKRVAAGEDPSKLSYLFPKKAGEWQRNFSYGYGDEDDAGNKTDIKMTNKEISLYNKAKAKGGAEGMRAALSNYIFHRFDADEKGHYTIPHDDNITPEEAEKLIKKFEGKSIREVEQWLYQDPRFKKANKAEQKQVLEDLWKLDGTGMATGSRREGERAVIKARGGDLVDYDYKNETPERVQKNLQEALDKGIVTAEQALDFTRNAVKYGYYPSADGKGGGTVTPYYNKKEMMEYLAKSGYSYEECEALYNAFRKKGSKEFSGIDLSSGGWHGYGYRRWHRWGSYQRKGRKPSNEMPSGFKAKKSRVSSGGSNVSAPNVSGGINTKSTASRVSSSPKINITPLDIKPVRASSSKSRRGSSNLAAALEDIQRTEKKVTPPKARRSR